ncbi:MAG TPA: 1-deoxy-D-xylulose-5-phosphate reductoisomerase [Candidatus Omnitrophota bacterium]|nr:1-deoxy-D-xylulose-5-phosphate reductoisomerase [Candidatus Omnitrophota bacterium]HPT06775.1 1-deoxy-D-xylulose-5-phosphate reductoisomerase [Candidatus Omnitrophota bacterium]
MKKRIAVLGSTGSVGLSTLDVVARFPGALHCQALSAHSNVEALLRQIRLFRPACVSVCDYTAASALRKKTGRSTKVFAGKEGMLEMLTDPRIDEVVVAISGSDALLPLLKAVDTGKDVVLANKESLAMAGELVMKRARRNNVAIKPVDSEQSAIWQCLHGQQSNRLKHLYLTASGGPFRGFSQKKLARISLADALRHPRWKMGKKITIDSATLMNKGLEVIEAMHLFGVDASRIKVVVHPEAIIHSMVEFIDGVVMAQLSETDMRIPIQYALTYPDRAVNAGLQGIDFTSIGAFHFEKPDMRSFPCLRLAYAAATEGGTAPCVLNAANEVAVETFMKEKISFIKIADIVERVLAKHRVRAALSLAQVFAADNWARQEAMRLLS